MNSTMYWFPTRDELTLDEFTKIADKWSMRLDNCQQLSKHGTWGFTCNGPAMLSRHENYISFTRELLDTSTRNSNDDSVSQTYFLTEQISTDPKTGGQKGKKPLEVGAVDPLARAELGKVAAFGGQKYSRGNYLKGYDWSLSVDALHRHMLAFESGEDYDPESGLLHTVHAAWHALALASFHMRSLGNDDRL